MFVVPASGVYSNSFGEKFQDSWNVSSVKVVAPINDFRVETEKLRVSRVLVDRKPQPLQVHVIKA